MQHQEYKLGVFAIACAAFTTACADAEGIAAPETGAAYAKSGLIQAQSMPASLSSAGLQSGVGANLCAQVAGAARQAGGQLVTSECTGAPDQIFTLERSGAITAYGGTLCLDASSARGRDGDPVIAWTCHGGANQKWQLTGAGQVKGINGKCLDVAGAATTRGASLIIYSCHGGANQRWTVRAASVADARTPAAAEPEPPPASVAPAPNVNAGAAELPRAAVDVAMPAATGRTIAVPAGGDLQAALDAARPGDVVTLAAGATYVGNYVLPAKAGSTAAGGGTIIVRPEAGVALPAAGTRLAPASFGAQLPKLVTRTVEPVVQTAAGAAGWRFVGIEFAVAPSQTLNYGLVSLGTGQETSAAELPARIVLDRVWVHGHATSHLKRCVSLNSASTAVVDSYLSDCHGRGQETQGMVGYNGPGPFRIENNYIEASGIGVLFGGADARIQGLVPSDISVRRNHFYKPLAWRGVWTVKNALECKSCQRLLAEHNVFENNWADAQAGFVLLFQGLTDENTAPWARIADITVRANLVKNAPGGINVLSRVAYGAGGVLPTQPGQRITVEQNVFDNIGQGYGRLMQLGGDLRDVTIANNTGAGTNSALMLHGTEVPAMERLVVRDNVFARGEYGVFGDGSGEGTAALSRFASSSTFAGNVVYGTSAGAAPSARYPAGNLFPESAQSVGLATYTSASLGSLTAALAPSSLTAAVGSARQPGADLAALDRALAGVVTR